MTGKYYVKGCQFPKEYLRLIKLSGLKIKILSQLLNIDYKRLNDLIYKKNTGMDNKEWKLISGFCDNIAKLESENYFI